MAAPRKHLVELKERAIRLWRSEQPRRPIAHLARELGVHPEAMRTWIRQDQAERGERDDLLTSEQLEELRRLRKENAELRRTNEILKAASAVSPRSSTDPATVMTLVDRLRDRFWVEPVLRVLEVPVSTFYGWLGRRRRPSPHDIEEAWLGEQIERIACASPPGRARRGWPACGTRSHGGWWLEGIGPGRYRAGAGGAGVCAVEPPGGAGAAGLPWRSGGAGHRDPVHPAPGGRRRAAVEGSVGDGYDNALAENFFAGLKVERVYRTREEAELDLVRWMDGWYHPRRIQRELGWLSPDEYEEAYYRRQSTGALASPAGAR